MQHSQHTFRERLHVMKTRSCQAGALGLLMWQHNKTSRCRQTLSNPHLESDCILKRICHRIYYGCTSAWAEHEGVQALLSSNLVAARRLVRSEHVLQEAA